MRQSRFCKNLPLHTQIGSHSGINMMELHGLKPLMAALKVLARAQLQTKIALLVDQAMRIKADVEETEAILAGYWNGVLEETRWELGERRQVAAGEESTLAMKTKSKAAKRKQQKRKAQQKKKAAEMAEAAAMAGGGKLTQEEAGIGMQALREKEREDEQKVERSEDTGIGKENEDGDAKEQAMKTATAALASNHALCLHFWVERCTEPTCPYCRSPLQKMGSA